MPQAPLEAFPSVIMTHDASAALDGTLLGWPAAAASESDTTVLRALGSEPSAGQNGEKVVLALRASAEGQPFAEGTYGGIRASIPAGGCASGDVAWAIERVFTAPRPPGSPFRRILAFGTGENVTAAASLTLAGGSNPTVRGNDLEWSGENGGGFWPGPGACRAASVRGKVQAGDTVTLTIGPVGEGPDSDRAVRVRTVTADSDGFFSIVGLDYPMAGRDALHVTCAHAGRVSVLFVRDTSTT